MNTTMSPGYLAEDNSAPLLGTSIAFVILDTIFLLLLWVSRYLAKGDRANGWMEALMTLTYITCVFKITTAFLLVEIGGTGRHLAALDPLTITKSLKLSLVLQIVCPLTTSLSKLGALCMFYRIFGQASKRYRVVIRLTFGLVLVIMIIQVLFPFFNCWPFSKNWNINGPGRCAVPSLALWRYLDIPNVLTTFIVVIIPIPALATLHVSRPMKFGLVVVFSVCILGIVAALMRMQSFLEVKNFNDISYEKVKPLCWTIAESGIYLFVGIMPTLKPLLRKLFKDTVFERMLAVSSSAKVSGSWGNKRFSLRRFKRDQPMVMVKEHRSLSNASSEGVSLVKPEFPKINTAVEKW